jgi:dihydroorotate dehydrogenase (fumarate)
MDLSTRYLGLDLKNPFVPSSSPLSKNVDTAKQLEDQGAAAIVMFSLFQETIENPAEPQTYNRHHAAGYGYDQGDSYLLGGGKLPTRQDDYLEQLLRLKQALDIPVIASLNGTAVGDWVDYGHELEKAGADALELNVYYVAANLAESAEAVEERLLTILRELKKRVDLPIGIKLAPYFSSIGNLVKRLEVEGASGISLFNRFYQPNIDLETLKMSSSLELSTSGDALLAMRWIAILHGRVKLSLAATGGIHFAEDALKVLLCGADVAHLGSTLLANGPEQLGRILNGTVSWLTAHGYESINEIRGILSQQNSADPAAFERGYYIDILTSYDMRHR